MTSSIISHREMLKANVDKALDMELPESLLYLYQDIQECFMSGNTSNETMDAVCKALQAFGQQGVIDIINNMLANKTLLNKIAKNAYLHKNGFYKILLLQVKNFALRLHIWMPGITAEETLHNHCWYLASTIISGSLKSEIWQESSSIFASFYDEYMYINKHVNPTYLGKVKAELLKTVIHDAGDAYVLAPNVLHRLISQQNKVIATLVCRSSHVQNWARNIIVNDRVPDVKPSYLAPEELAKILKKYLLLIAI